VGKVKKDPRKRTRQRGWLAAQIRKKMDRPGQAERSKRGRESIQFKWLDEFGKTKEPRRGKTSAK